MKKMAIILGSIVTVLILIVGILSVQIVTVKHVDEEFVLIETRDDTKPFHYDGSGDLAEGDKLLGFCFPAANPYIFGHNLESMDEEYFDENY